MSDAPTTDQVDQPTAPIPPARRLGILLTVVIVVLVLDQASKYYAIEHLKNAPARQYLGGKVILTYAENTGAFGSMFGTMSDTVRWAILTLGNGVLLAGVAAYVLMSKAIDRPTFWALALILAGGLGNLIDRLQYGTVVIDFLFVDSGLPYLKSNIFNIADVAITIGFLILVFPVLGDLFRAVFGSRSETAKTAA